MDPYGIDWGKMLGKIMKKIGYFSIPLFILVILVVIVLTPIMWLGSLIGMGDQEEMNIEDIRDTAALWQAEHHVSFKFSDLLACTMSSASGYSAEHCFDVIKDDGTWEGEYLDTEMSGVYEIWNTEGIREKQGKIPDSAYEDLWIPTIYVIDYYRQVEVVKTDVPVNDPEYGKVTIEWVYDHTGEEQFKDSCSDNPPSSQCRVIREGFYTYPYTPASRTAPTKKYGYMIDENNDDVIQIHDGLTYQSGSALSLSTGVVSALGEDPEMGKWVEMEYNHGGYHFFARYEGLTQVLYEIGEVLEWNQEIGYASEFTVRVYEKDEQGELMMNPSILFEPDALQSSGIGELIPGDISSISGFEFMLPFSDYVITQEYGGTNIDGNMHNGIDLQPRPFSSAAGHPIVAGFDGVVVSNEYNSISGNLIGIKDSKTGIIVRYCHMIERSSLSPGIKIQQGQVIGYVGMTGLATGYHVHLTFVVGGTAIDPRTLVQF